MPPISTHYAYIRQLDLDNPTFWRAEGLPGLAQLAAQAQAMPYPKPKLSDLYKRFTRLPRIIRGFMICRRAA